MHSKLLKSKSNYEQSETGIYVHVVRSHLEWVLKETYVPYFGVSDSEPFVGENISRMEI